MEILSARVETLRAEIEKDVSVLEQEKRKNQSGYNSVISGARHRISVNQTLLEQYQRMMGNSKKDG